MNNFISEKDLKINNHSVTGKNEIPEGLLTQVPVTDGGLTQSTRAVKIPENHGSAQCL